MRAVSFVDGRVELREHPDPQPGAGELLVRVRAAGLNNADLLQRSGLYPAPAGVPADIPGLELAGEVVACGPGATRFAPGDRVMALVAGAAQAELAVVHERHAMPIPDRMGWAEAGGFPEAFVTAHDALFTQCRLTLGERLLVHGAAGGVGVAAVQLGRAAGARVTATVRDPARREAVRALGASTVIAPEEFTRYGPYDVVCELVGAPNLPGDLDALAVGGRIAVIGTGAGAWTEVNLLAVMAKRAQITGSTLRARSLEEKAVAIRAVEARVLPLVETEAVRVPVLATFPLTEAAAAYDRFAAGGKLGKIVLVT